MRKVRTAAAAASVVVMLAFAASAQATGITSSTVTSPADGTLLFQNLDTSPNQTITVSGTTDGTTGEFVDIGCYSSTYNDIYAGSGSGFAVNPDGSFSATVSQRHFRGESCQLVAVPHAAAPASLAGTSYTGPRVGFSIFQSTGNPSYMTPGGALFDYTFNDDTTSASNNSNSIDSCGPNASVVDGSSAMNSSPYLFDCAANFYNKPSMFGGSSNPGRSEIEVDGQNAYGSQSADKLFPGSDTLAGFPALTVSMDSFDPSTGNAQTTEREPLVKCTPSDVYGPTSANCTAFGSTGVSIKRVTAYSDAGRVATVTDTYSSTDGLAHSLDLEYETDLTSTAGWELPGQASFLPRFTGETAPSPGLTTGTIYVIDDTGAAPSLANPVGAMTFGQPYHGITFNNTLWVGTSSALVDYQNLVPASGSVTIAWSYATGTSLAEVQGDATAALDAVQPLAVTISSPTAGTSLLSQPVKVSGTASAGSGVKSVTVNGVAATVSGGSWSASVPLTKGTDTLTATVTSNAGHTATASATVAYVPLASLTFKRERFTGKAVSMTVACDTAGSDCNGTLKLTYTEAVVKHHKRHTVTVGSVTKHPAVAAGKTASVSVTLSAKERRALKSAGKLNVSGIVMAAEPNGGPAVAAHGGKFTLTIKQPAKKHHK
jgi:hypothetical protein